MSINWPRSIGSVVVAVATIVTIVALGVVVFFNPIWVSFEQDRTGADRFTGYTKDEVHAVTGQILAQMVVGPPAFDMTVGGQPVFDEKERAHLADVRGVFVGLGVLTLVSIVVLLAASRAKPPRRWVWIGVAGGAATLGTVVVALGIFFGVAFDTAFDLFHRLFFGAGSYTFNPLTERLVQIFPEDFWFETSLVLAVVLILLSVVAIVIAIPKIDRPEPGTAKTAEPAPPAESQVTG